MSEIFSVNCPICKKTLIWKEINIFRPFCSKRCQLIDLGEWVKEEKFISGEDLFSKKSNYSTE